MSQQRESKHDRFLRLMQRRLTRALEELRLVSQLASPNYEHQPEEAQEVLRHLDEAVRRIAHIFGVPYATRLGKGAAHSTDGSAALGPVIRKTAVLDEIEIVRTLEEIQTGNLEAAITRLRAGIGAN